MKLDSANIAVFGILISCLCLWIVNESYLDQLDIDGVDVRRGLADSGAIASYFGQLQSMLTTLILGNIAFLGFLINALGGISSFDNFARVLAAIILLEQIVAAYIVYVSRMEIFRLLDTNAVSFQAAMDRIGLPAFLIFLGFVSSVFLALYVSRNE